MIIVCPECSTRFKIADERVPDDGVKVRCARCKHVFRAEKALSQDTEVQADNIDASVTTQAGGTEESTEFSYDRFQELDTAEKNAGLAVDGDTEKISGTIEKAVTSDDTAKEVSAPSGEEEPLRPAAEEAPIEIPSPQEEQAALEAEVEDPAAANKGGLSSVLRILLLLIVAIVAIGAALVYMNGPEVLDSTIQKLFGQSAQQQTVGHIAIDSTKGDFIQNQHDGELFVIHGSVRNVFSDARSSIQVKGVIFDPDGKALLQKTVFCGNPLSEEDLKTLSFTELEKKMGNQFGTELSNMNVGTGESILYAIAFKDLPQSLSEFSVKVTASKPANN